MVGLFLFNRKLYIWVMAKKRDWSQYGKSTGKTPTNYRVVLVIGKALDRAKVADGLGWAPSQQEAEKMFSSLIKKTWGVLKAELYFNNHLIKKR